MLGRHIVSDFVFIFHSMSIPMSKTSHPIYFNLCNVVFLFFCQIITCQNVHSICFSGCLDKFYLSSVFFCASVCVNAAPIVRCWTMRLNFTLQTLLEIIISAALPKCFTYMYISLYRIYEGAVHITA